MANQANRQNDVERLRSDRSTTPWRLLDRFVGTWSIKGRTLDSPKDNIAGTVTIEWLPGGFLMQQQSRLSMGTFEVKSLEIVTYDPVTKRFPSYVYTAVDEGPLLYGWEIHDDLIVHVGLGARFNGIFSSDGNTLTGHWGPEAGTPATPVNSYDVTMTRMPSPQ